MSTTEFIIAGLLPEMVGGLKVSVAQAGLLITPFATGVIVGAPTTFVGKDCLVENRDVARALVLPPQQQAHVEQDIEIRRGAVRRRRELSG